MAGRLRALRTVAGVTLAFAAWLATARCGGGNTNAPTVPVTPTGPVNPTGPTGPTGPILTEVLVGAGDIGYCGIDGAKQTGQLLDSIQGTVFTAGDNAYTHGSVDEFARCYEPFWGRHKSRTRPVPGNHEYEGGFNAVPYFNYFGGNAGPQPGGYYSYEVGDWHIIALNSNIDITSITGAQLSWLKADLAAHQTASCSLAIWHHPRFASGLSGNTGFVDNLWRLLFQAGVDVVVNGHDHSYEVFQPQTPDQVRNDTFGIREFVVGTGGAVFYDFPTVQPNSQRRIANRFGVLKLALSTGSYSWEFVTQQGVADSGGPVQCHDIPR